jgi:hypothetical protein
LFDDRIVIGGAHGMYCYDLRARGDEQSLSR